MTRKRVDNSAAAHASQRKEYYEAMTTMANAGCIFFGLGSFLMFIEVCTLLLNAADKLF